MTLFTDSIAARGIIHREGLGKLRHLETGYLLLQAAVKNKRLQVRRVLGTENPADLFTKHLGVADMWKHLTTLHMPPEEGRTSTVPGIRCGLLRCPDGYNYNANAKLEFCRDKSLLVEASIQLVV